MTYKVRKQSALVTAAVVREEKLYIIYLQSVRQRVLHPKKRYQHQRALMKQEKASTRELFWIKRKVSTSGKGLEVIRNSVLLLLQLRTLQHSSPKENLPDDLLHKEDTPVYRDRERERSRKNKDLPS
ncbi:hypothetical protein PS6_011596 [Mucor atramentarius]